MAAFKTAINVVGTNSTNANFQAWGSAVSNAFTQCGWTEVTGIGEINWGTVAKPDTASTVMGFEIWKMADALQTTAPVTLKIEYGSGPANTSPGLWLQLGANNSGNALTGILSNRQNVYSGGQQTASAPCFICGDTNRIIVGMHVSLAGNCFAFGIERTHDAAGADTGEGITVGACYNSTSWYQTYWNCATGPTSVGPNVLCFMPPDGAGTGQGGGSTGAVTTLYPVYFYKGTYTQPSLNFMMAFARNVTNTSSLTVTHLGAAHTYLPLTALTPNGMSTPLTSGNNCLLIRWE
jgi:hypothetical protein